ncbi:MAG: NADH-quinone oxidoreductase subunit A [Cyanobacteria bacterium]|nr:NADH-quinone oxidoreductase subunit A [Cyanobacteriota bacterium]
MHELQLGQILIFLLMGFVLPALGMIGLSYAFQYMFGYHTPNAMKNQPYECGMKPMQESIVQFDVRYYLYALLFILFDIEVIFIIPWALGTDQLPAIFGKENIWLGPLEMLVFLVILAFGLAYAWKKGALEWE